MAITANYVNNQSLFYGLSTDTKPTSANVGSKFIETNTFLEFKWTGSTWLNVPTTTSSVEYNEVQSGGMFTLSKTFLAVATNAFVDVRLTAGTKPLHFVLNYTSEEKARLQTYLGTTYTGAGTVVTPFNRKTDSTQTLTAVCRIAPTVGTLGQIRGDDMIGSSTTGGNKSGGTGGYGLETIIAPNHDILIRLTNVSAQAKDLNAVINMYEI